MQSRPGPRPGSGRCSQDPEDPTRAGGAGAIVLEGAGSAGIRGNLAYYADLLKNKKKLIGKKVTVRYQGLTPDGKLRFPVMVAVRDYE